MDIPVVVQHRHVHLSAADQATLFGADASMKRVADVGHDGQAAYQETVTLVGKNGQMEDVRVLGPCREETQVELSASEAFALGIDAPLRVSGDVKRAASCGLKGPHGSIRSRACVIVPVRHLHCGDADAKRLGIRHRDTVALTPVGRPDLRMEHVAVRVHPSFGLSFHLSADEAAQFWLHTGDRVRLER